MTRALLAASAVALVALAGPASAGGGAGSGISVEDGDKHICVVTNSQKREGYCVTTWGVELPDLPDLP